MAIMGLKGFKSEYSYELAETSSNTSTYQRTLDFSGGEGTYKIRIFFMENTYQTLRSRQGGIKFTNASGTDITWKSSNVRMLTSSFYHWAGANFTNWWGDHEIWIPHMWSSITSDYPRQHVEPMVYDITVRAKAGKSMFYGVKKSNNNGSNTLEVHGLMMGFSENTNIPQKLVIDRYASVWWTRLSMEASRVREV